MFSLASFFSLNVNIKKKEICRITLIDVFEGDKSEFAVNCILLLCFIYKYFQSRCNFVQTFTGIY